MNKIALITGGTSGLGKAMAIALSNNNYRVYAGGRNTNSLESTNRLCYTYLDVTNSEIVKSVVNEIILKHGKIDLLINCAGIGFAGAVEEIPITEIEKAFQVNFYGSIRMVQEVSLHMRKKGSGKIVNISSIGGLVGLPFQGIYSSTKFAIEGLSEALYTELKPYGISVSIIEPGDYNTNVSNNRIAIFPKESSAYSERLNGFFDRLSANIDKSLDPTHIEKTILKIANTKHPKFRYKSGRLYEKVTPLAKQILPDKLFLKILASFYKL
jgi:NAD(P)-dependent dehydrogenase (short-subunit alcohol dehydrogenase family)